MKHRNWCTLFLVYGLMMAPLVKAQSSEEVVSAVNGGTLQMLKATVEFLATDRQTFPNARQTKCADCQTEAQLRAFISANRLEGADGLVSRVQKSKSDLLASYRKKKALNRQATKLILKDLEKYIQEEIIQNRNRAYRKTLPAYAAFTQQLSQIEAAPTPVGQATADSEPAGSYQEAGIGQPTTDEAAADSSAYSADSVQSLDAVPSNKTMTNESTFPYDIVALILAIISLLFSVYLYLRSRRGVPEQSVKTPFVDHTSTIKDLDRQVKALQTELKRLQVEQTAPAPTRNPQPNVLEQMPQSTPKPSLAPPTVSVNPPASGYQTHAVPVEKAETPPAQPQPQPAPTPPQSQQQVAPAPAPVPAPAPTPAPAQPRQLATLYGRTADLGDGFSIRGLSPNPDRDTVFEIARHSDVLAIFRVSDNPELQRLALSDPYSYLNDTCTYLTQPRPGSRIVTTQPGRLVLQGEKWVITEKAQITFQ